MDVVCPKCSSTHRAEPPSSLRARGAVRFRCTHCGNVFKVEFPALGTTIVPPEPPTTPLPGPSAPPSAVFTVRAAGEVYPPTDLATLHRWILESRVKPEDELSVDGDRWERAGDRPELILFFNAADRLHAPLVYGLPSMSLPPPPNGLSPPTISVPPRYAPPPELDDLGGPEREGAAEDERPPEDERPADDGWEPEVDAVEERWPDETAPAVAKPEPAPLPPAPVEAPLPPDPVSEELPMVTADPDTQEETLVSILQERTEEIRKAPVPVRRDYSQRSLPPGAASMPGASNGVAAHPVSPVAHADEHSSEFDFPEGSALDDEEPPPNDNRTMGILALMVAVLILGVVVAVGWRVMSADEPEEVPKTETVAKPEPPPEPVVVREPDPVVPDVPLDVLPVVDPVPPDEPIRPEPPVAVAPEPVVVPVARPEPPAAKPPPVQKPPTTTTTAAPSTASEAAKQGWALVNKGKLEEAFDAFSKGLQKSPGNAQLLHGRGYANEKLGDDISAAADYCDAMKSKSVSDDTRQELQSGMRRLNRTCPG